jgi:hypothetical protein
MGILNKNKINQENILKLATGVDIKWIGKVFWRNLKSILL